MLKHVAVLGLGTALSPSLTFLNGGQAEDSESLSYEQAVESSGDGLDFRGFRDEYRDACANWPYALPADKEFPREPSFTEDPDDPAIFQRGIGETEACLQWSRLTSEAASEAFEAGRIAEADTYLSRLLEAYSGPKVRSMIVDPDGRLIPDVILPAIFQRDFLLLKLAFGA